MKLYDKLEQRAAHHEQMAASIRLTLQDLQATDTKKARATVVGKVKAATRIRNHKAKRSAAEAKVFTSHLIAAVAHHKKPATVADVLDHMKKDGHEIKDGRGIAGVLASATRYGYLKKTKKGYTATDKPYPATAADK